MSSEYITKEELFIAYNYIYCVYVKDELDGDCVGYHGKFLEIDNSIWKANTKDIAEIIRLYDEIYFMGNLQGNENMIAAKMMNGHNLIYAAYREKDDILQEVIDETRKTGGGWSRDNKLHRWKIPFYLDQSMKKYKSPFGKPALRNVAPKYRINLWDNGNDAIVGYLASGIPIYRKGG